MNIYTVSFFGHRQIENDHQIETKLETIIYDIISKKEYVEFLVGREGAFDLMVSSVIKRIITDYGDGNASLILVLPYMKAEYRDNRRNFHNYYHDVEICEASAKAHYKSAIQIRNRNMVDRSDLVICCIQHQSGGAYKTVQYAKKKNCPIIYLGKR